MTKLHITQSDDGRWMLSAEMDTGEMRRIGSFYDDRDHLIHDALEMVEKGKYPGATVIIEAGRLQSAGFAAVMPAGAAGTKSGIRPAPRRARL
jgi:hypothetical protein